METCNAVGCFKPRHKSTGGYEYSYCYDHWLQRMEGFKWEEKPQKEEIMAKSDVCKVEGCGKPRMRNRHGEMLTMCEDHQREYWRKEAAKKRDPQAAPVKKLSRPQSSDPIAIGFSKVQQAADEVSAASRRAFPETAKQLDALLSDDQTVQHNCETCYAKGVIEALRAKSPKLAALIDAMEAQERAAHELGL